MSKSANKVTFKVILTSEIDQPFKVVTVPEEAPFSAVIRYICDEFRVDERTTSILTMDGIGINPDQNCGEVFLKFGGDLKMIPRDRVGSSQ